MLAHKQLLWILVLSLFAIGLCLADEQQDVAEKKDAHAWNYDKQGGPSRWDKMYPDECGEGKHRQSPVNIDTSLVSFYEDFNLVNIVYNNATEHTMTVLNNGHTVKVNIEGAVNIVGGGLGDSYQILQLHFHWGSEDDHGSEHNIDGESFPLEMHMVSYDSSRFVALKDALSGFNSLAVVGTLFDVVEEDNPVFEPIVQALSEIKHKDASVSIDWIDPQTMIPQDTSHFYRYDGSLTTPPCLENVLWTVFAKQQTISKAQLNKFRELIQPGDTDDIPLANNFRPPQPLHGRKIYSSFQPTNSQKVSGVEGDSDTSSIVTSSVTLVFGMLVLFFS